MKRNPLKVAVVILNYNGKKHLECFLPSVVSFTSLPEVEIIIVDNCSTDDSVNFITTNYPNLTLKVLDKNFGFAGGYNRALQNIDAEYFVLLNSDVEVTANWLQSLMSYMDEHPQCAACQPKLLSYSQKTHFEYAGAAGGFIDKYGYPYCRGRVFSSLEEDLGQYNSTINVFWASGACLFIRKEAFENVQGFDENFFAHMEEIDLCWRIKKTNQHIACVPDSVVYHLGGGTLNKESPFKTYLNFRNNLLMLHKNLPASERRKVLIVRFFLDYIASFQMLASGKFANAKSVWKAKKDYRKLSIQYTNQTESGLGIYPEVYTRNLVLSYYLKGIQKFSEMKKGK